MAHEDLKKLYEIDKQNSDDPYQYWEFEGTLGGWFTCPCPPAFYPDTEYRRKPGAPVWPVSDDAEDARKWRELEAFYQGNDIMKTARKFLEIIEPKLALIEGHTADQWQAIIEGGFLCQFSGTTDFSNSGAAALMRFDPSDEAPFWVGQIGWRYCRPLRLKGHRQPWFGGECPVACDAQVYVKYKNGPRHTVAAKVAWENVTEFIEL